MNAAVSAVPALAIEANTRSLSLSFSLLCLMLLFSLSLSIRCLLNCDANAASMIGNLNEAVGSIVNVVRSFLTTLLPFGNDRHD